MSLSDASETNWLKLLLQNVNWAGLGDATGLRGSSAAGNLYISLHTADPTDAGDQTASEAAYTNYARVAVPRSTSGFDVSGNTGSNHATVSFPQCGVTTGATVTYFGIGVNGSGAGELVLSGPLAAPLVISNLITPIFDPNTLQAQDD